MTTIGSMFSGIGGLELAVESLGAQTVWQVENDPKASAVLARWWPEVPNYQDVSTVDWAGVQPVDILTAGFPCQDISTAGKGAGLSGKRSGLWSEIVTAVRHLRPGIVFVENVSALIHRGLPAVIADLAALGYISTWGVFRAADVGACHRRERLFLIATDADCSRWQRWAWQPGQGGASISARRYLATPTANLGANGGSQHPVKRRGGGHSVSLADQVEHLLPTPVAHDDGKSPEAHLAMKARLPGGPRRAITSLAVLARANLEPRVISGSTPQPSNDGPASSDLHQLPLWAEC